MCQLCHSTASPPEIHICKEDAKDIEIAKYLENVPEEHRWLHRKCHQCGVWIEKETACNHMTCTCGGQFCSCCGRQWQGHWVQCRGGCPKHERPEYYSEGYNQNGYRPSTGLDRDGVTWEAVHGQEGTFGEWGYEGLEIGWNYDAEGVDALGRDRNGPTGEIVMDLTKMIKTSTTSIVLVMMGTEFREIGTKISTETPGVSYNIFGYNQFGWSRQGRDVDGRDREGNDNEGYDREGFNRWYVDRQGLRPSGYTLHHKDLEGNIEPGYYMAPGGNVQPEHECVGYGCCRTAGPLIDDYTLSAQCHLCGSLVLGALWDESEADGIDVPFLCDSCYATPDNEFKALKTLPVWERSGALGFAEMIERIKGQDWELCGSTGFEDLIERVESGEQAILGVEDHTTSMATRLQAASSVMSGEHETPR
ncbi:hypothetical protein Slin15195_G088750 [Septoria linicola]|uniref:RING-type domain-containing protein n=1 Tax=Septoria linicola TaxID=215465 RepID=A0A9Q9B3B1_9PEZI|nr:hypothetical protein Slin15195_G088750 [Septoria linicola]